MRRQKTTDDFSDLHRASGGEDVKKIMVAIVKALARDAAREFLAEQRAQSQPNPQLKNQEEKTNED